MPAPLNRREFDVFLSHAHVDHRFADALYAWLRKAGLSVWYDKVELAAGAAIATELQRAITRCRGVLVVASDEAMKRGWVLKEYNSAVDEETNFPGFRVVALRIANADVSSLMKGVSWIDVPRPELDAATALAIIRSFYPGGERWPDPSNSRDVYVSCSWHQDDRASAFSVARVAAAEGFRLIGDAQDQAGFGTGNRVERIISSCGAFIAVIPYRGVAEATAGEKPYKYFLQEIDFAVSLGLPLVVVADPRVTRTDRSSADWLPMATDTTDCPDAVKIALRNLWDEWRKPPTPHFVFCALDLDAPMAAPDSALRHIVERITAVPVIVGPDITEEPIVTTIRRKLCEAFVVVADVSDNNLNTCIEAGMALAAGANVELVAKGEQHSPPFMLRGLQLKTYRDDVEQIAVLHKAVRPYRRRVINAEL